MPLALAATSRASQRPGAPTTLRLMVPAAPASSPACRLSRPPALLRWSGCGSRPTASASPGSRPRVANRRLTTTTTTAAAAATLTTAATATTASSPFAAAFAVALGYAVVAGSLVRSVPQIVKVVKARSAEGLSLVAVAVELLCYTVTIAYNASRGYPLNTYGEVAACWLQDVALVLLVLRFGAVPRAAVSRHPRRAALAGALFAALIAWLLSPACPRDLLAALQAANVAVLALGSRVPQIVLNVRRGDAGLLSATSCALNVAGNAARAFTTLVLTRDALLLAGALTQGALNGVLFWQAMATRRQRRKVAAAEEAVVAAATAAKEEEQEEQQQEEKQGVGAVLPATAGGSGPATVYAAG